MMANRVLVLGTYVNPPYHPMTGVDARLKEILSGAELIFTDDLSQLSRLRTEHFDAVVSYLDIWFEDVADGPAQELARYVEAGGGLLVLHSGICLARNPLLPPVIGGAFTEHPAQETVTFHPMAGGLLSGIEPFAAKEEPYRFTLAPEGNEIILSYVYHGEIWPAGWKRPWGKGRVCMLCPGHTPEIFDIPAYREMIARGFSWCSAAE